MSAFSRPATRVHKHRPAASERRSWIEAIDGARACADLVLGTSLRTYRASLDEMIGDLRMNKRGLAARGFPGSAEAVSAGRMADGFLAIAEAFCVAAGERRRLYAGALDASAKVLEDLLDELRSREAQAWQRQTGERD